MQKIIYHIFTTVILVVLALVLSNLGLTLKLLLLRQFLLILIVCELAILVSILLEFSLSERAKNLLSLLFVLCLVFFILESTLMYFPQSEGGSRSLSSKVWHQWYWGNPNSAGFRDSEQNLKDWTILFIGDSFTAGHGIKKRKDRTSNIVGDSLVNISKEYSVINLGENGADTRKMKSNLEYFLQSAKEKPSHIVLQYLGNDINGIAEEFGLDRSSVKNPYEELPKPIRFVIKSSFLLDFIYWKIPSDDNSYLNYYSRAFNSPIAEAHFKEIENLVELANENAPNVIFVIYPFLTDVNLSEKLYVQKIENLLKEKNVEVINVCDLIQDVPTKELIVNKMDGHPSKLVNKILADELIKNILKWKYSKN